MKHAFLIRMSHRFNSGRSYHFCRYSVIGNMTDSQSVDMVSSNLPTDTNLSKGRNYILVNRSSAHIITGE